METVNEKVSELLEQLKAVEESRADEKKAQEEVADEFESMQMQVKQLDARIAKLVEQIKIVKKQSEEKTEEMEKLKQEAAEKEAASEVEAKPDTELAAEADTVHRELEQRRLEQLEATAQQFRMEDLGMASATQPGASFIVNPAVHRPEEPTGAAALPFPAPRPLEELTVPSRAHRSPSIQDATAMDSRQWLSQGRCQAGGRMLPGRQEGENAGGAAG